MKLKPRLNQTGANIGRAPTTCSKNETPVHLLPTLVDRLRSGYHRMWYEASQALRWSRGTFREPSMGLPTSLLQEQYLRIAEIAQRYDERFETHYAPETAWLNYGYLDLLDTVRTDLDWEVPKGQSLCDLGCGNFAYARALYTFFRPAHMTGVEVDGHRVYSNGKSRIDYAQGHIQDLPNTTYVVEDYRQYQQRAEIITAWYPFVTPKPLLAWRLPLSLFDPLGLFTQIATNLVFGGTFLMVNHNPSEARVAKGIAESVGLVCRGQYVHTTPVRPRSQPSVLSLWQHS